MVNSMEILKEVNFFQLKVWDVKSYFRHTDIFNPKYPVVLFGDFLSKPIIEKTKIEDEKEYKILGVRSYGKGAFINRTVKGNTLKMRTYQVAEKNHLFWCKVDTKNGAFGIIDESLSNGVASSNMTFAKIELDKANPQYVQLLFQSKKVNHYMDGYVTGTTNRKYIKPDQLRNEIKIPLPPPDEQNRIVANYNTKIQLANQQEQKAKQLEQEIENYLFEALGIEKLEEKESVKGLQLVHFKNIDRWDVLAKDLRILNGLSNCNYELKKIGEVFNFPSRSWKKKEYKKNTFNYIELGAINATTGITELKEIEVQNAPSRATQEVKTGDFLIGTTRPYLKRFVIIEPKYEGNICSSGFSIIEPSQNYNLYYLKEFLMSYFGLEQLKNRMTGGTYPAITNNELKEILVPFPKVEIQNEIANHISGLKQQIKDLQSQAKENRDKAIQAFEEEIFS